MKWSSLYGWTFSSKFLLKSFKICQCFFISQTFLVKPYIFIDIFISVRSFIFIQFSILKVWFRFETLKEDNLRAEMALITNSGSRAEQSCCCHLHFSSNASKSLILDFFFQTEILQLSSKLYDKGSYINDVTQI